LKAGLERMTPCYKSFENAHLTCENSTKANLKNSKRTICLCEEHFQNSENLFFFTEWNVKIP